MRIYRRILLAALIAAVLPGQQLHGQARIQGTVLDVITGDPIEGATITMRSSRREARTGSLGIYTFEGVRPGKVILEAEAPGFVSVMEEVDVGSEAAKVVNFELGTLFGALEELQVEARRRADRPRGQSVGVVEEEDGRGTPGANASELIRGTIPGAMVLRPSGQVGSGYEILVRGFNTVAGDREPVIFLDGIRLNTSQRGRLMAGVRSAGSIELVDPFTIDRIEVLKGASAGARYGADATGGVILIYTKGH